MSNPLHYILEDGKPVPTDAITHGDWIIETPFDERRIGITRLGSFEVSTVFIGTYSHLDKELRPLIFETMISKDGKEERKALYATKKEAETGHRLAVERVQGMMK